MKLKEKILLVLILATAFFLRVWRYYDFPVGGETADESAWTLLGASLIQERVPASWSYFLPYENYHYVEGLFDAPIVRPALDHPPLFSLVPGTAHSLKSFWLDSPSFKVIRLPMVLLGTLNVLLFWFVVRQIFAQTKWVVLATALFATIPTIVFGSRLVVAENLLITWILLAMLLVFRRPTKQRTLWLVLISIAAVLTKVAGLIVPISLLVYGLLTRQKIVARTGVVGGLLGIGLFAFYGVVYNWPLFVAVVAIQSTRALGLATLQNRLFLNPVLVKHIFFDGWQVMGIMAAVALLLHRSNDKKLLLAHIFTVASLLFIALSVGESTFHGWYDFVLWPSLIISLAGFLKILFETSNTLLFGIFWLMTLPVMRLALVFTDQYEHLAGWLVRVMIGLGFLPLLWQTLDRQKLVRITPWLLLIGLLGFNVVTILTVSHEAYWVQAAFFELPL
ncbi:MAG: Glycosyl transferase family 39 [Candidatus Pacebacteria bacterium GW2011_GWB1_47_8]|nr:MAG: Glycosyl transferase family 39 [Candidatus Pacebacteria bacterium GW2011_GWA1_46_10]KKU84368.1 MAG: Glycosyl transferase family 39 [Candidatus Pacebacteria bacterium GW2011_GWB1_47_8]HCR81206.1 hypothetical protein [Candidatus Paceibacterota bacterium]